jgi:hypothetical protein
MREAEYGMIEDENDRRKYSSLCTYQVCTNPNASRVEQIKRHTEVTVFRLHTAF